MTQDEITARRLALAKEYLALPDAWSDRALQIAAEFGELAEVEDHLLRTGKAGQIATQEGHAMRLSLVAAKSLCREMGISRQVVHRLKLRAGMEEDAVRTLAAQHLRLVQKRLREANGTERLVEEPLTANDQGESHSNGD